MKQKEKLIVILGATAVGKTNLSIDLAERIRTEIISGDSMLVYKNLNIGTAKPTKEELKKVRHYMIDILEPFQRYNVTDFLNEIKPIITFINSKGKIPILVGGTGLYLKALLEGYSFCKQGEDESYRIYLEELAKEKGNLYIYDILRNKDPITANKIHPNNLRRVIRALETIHLNNESISDRNFYETNGDLVYNVKVIGLNRERKELYDRINLRVELMLEMGLVDEVKQLLDKGATMDWQSMRGIGYKEIIAYLDKKCTLEEAIENLKKNTRHFAKRQITWFKKMPYIKWFDMAKYEKNKEDFNLLIDVLNYIKEDKFYDK